MIWTLYHKHLYEGFTLEVIRHVNVARLGVERLVTMLNATGKLISRAAETYKSRVDSASKCLFPNSEHFTGLVLTAIFQSGNGFVD
jgi:hypothetical protein